MSPGHGGTDRGEAKGHTHGKKKGKRQRAEVDTQTHTKKKSERILHAVSPMGDGDEQPMNTTPKAGRLFKTDAGHKINFLRGVGNT